MHQQARGPAAGAVASLFLLLLVATPGHADVEAYLGRPVASIRFVNEGRPAGERGLIDVVETRPGAPLSMMAVRESIAHLYSLGRFEDVRANATEGAAGISLSYELTPLHAIERIRFAMTAPAPGVDEGDLRRAVGDRFGVSPAARRADEVAGAVAAALAARGYRRARVTSRVDLEHAPHRATLVLSLEPGPRSVVDRVEVAGVTGPDRDRLIERLGVAPGRPWLPDELNTRIERYLADQRASGYYEARLAAKPEFSQDDRLVTLVLAAEPGPLVRVVFTGDPVPADARDALVPIEQEGSADEDLLEDSSNRIEEYLRAQGYRDAAARYERRQSGSELTVTFDVKRGSRYRVAGVEVSGNTFLATAALESQLQLRAGQPFLEERLDADVATIEDLYRRRGFVAVSVRSGVDPQPAAAAADTPVVVRIVVTENARAIVGSVRIAGNDTVPPEPLLDAVGLRPGGELFLPQLAVDRDAVQARYADRGYLSATVEASPGLSEDGTRADIVFTIREGPRILVDHVLIVGNERTRADTIAREVQIRPGEPLALSAVTESQRRLTALGLFRRTRIVQLAHGDETTRDLLIVVEESAPTTIGYGGGLEGGQRIRRTEDQAGVASERLEFAPRAFFEITRRNLWGKNRSVNLFTRISLRPETSPAFTDEQQPVANADSGVGFSEYRILGTFREPRVFGSAADALLTVTAEQQIRSSFNFARRAFNAQADRRISRTLSAGGSYQIQRTELFDEQFNPADKLLIDRLFPQVLLSSFSGSVIRDTRDDQLDPGSGQYFSANGQLAARRIGSEVGLAKSYLTAQLFRRLPGASRVVLAGSARLGMAVGFAREAARIDEAGQPVLDERGQPVMDVIKDLPASERFFAGGDTTVRGFALDQLGTPETIDEDGFPIGGNALVIFNAEMRVRMLGGLGVVGFVDSGNVFARTGAIDLGQLRSAVGVGLRYGSPVGPIRVDVGFKVNRRDLVPGSPEKAAIWHVSLGQAF
jgi:outer membrane protein assembly complex protein YaeT